MRRLTRFRLNVMLEKISDKTFNEDSAETKWIKLLSENDFLPFIHKLASVIFSIPVTNAFVERVFFLVLLQWSKEKHCQITVASSNKSKLELLQDARPHFKRSKIAEANC